MEKMRSYHFVIVCYCLTADMESIDALAKAINEYEGGLVLVSHDMRLISQVANEIWICDNKTITKHPGDIQSFKMHMRAQMGIEGEQAGQLRGDASTKKKEGTPKNEPAKSAAIKEPATAPSPVEPPKPTEEIRKKEEDSLFTPEVPQGEEPAKEPAPAAPVPAPSKGKYIPPHLRRKMAAEEAAVNGDS